MYAVTIDSVVYSPTYSTKKECKEYMKILRKKYPKFRGHEWNITTMPESYNSLNNGLSESLHW